MPVLGAPAFVISGSSRAGKTSLGARLANELGCPLASFGDYVRSRARVLLGDVIPTRRYLQDLGQELVRADPEAFCRAALSPVGVSPERPIVIDGLRHVGLVPLLVTLVGVRELRLIFVDATPEARIERWDGEITKSELNAVDTHPVETDLAQLRERADLIIDARMGLEEAFKTLMQWITRTYPALEKEIRL
jgi:dephospho-CoA kinase